MIQFFYFGDMAEGLEGYTLSLINTGKYVHKQSHWKCLTNVMSQSPMMAYSNSNNIYWAYTMSYRLYFFF